MRRASFVVLVALLTALAVPALAVADKGDDPRGADRAAGAVDTVHAGKDVELGELDIEQLAPEQLAQLKESAVTAAGVTPPVGTTRYWLGLDDAASRYFVTTYTLMAVGSKSEIWVQTNLNFPSGDCRNDGVRNVITQAQVDYLRNQFEMNIYPKESSAFSVPPERDGANAILPALLGLPQQYYTGGGDKIVILISNVRDSNYYDTNNQNQFSYIAGFFSSQLNDFFDRNVMTIDSFDWPHRTGANPPNEPVPGDPCASKPARPFLYEGVFAHEYQHLLESYESPAEQNWVNEGLSDFAAKLTGYNSPDAPITNQRFDSHVQCFLGWLSMATPANPNPRPDSGPENSLTLWGDQGDDEILCDYGAAYSMMLYLHGRYGLDFMTALHQNDLDGLPGLDAVLDQFGIAESAQDILHRWAVMVAVDQQLENVNVYGQPSAKPLYSTPALHAVINWDEGDAYSESGAPPNGADYVRFRKASGQYVSGEQLRSLTFNGASTLPALPVEWTVDSGALYSGTGDLIDRAIVRQVNVPSVNATLSFDTRWNLEETWDFGFVQVSTDGGATYQSVACDSTRTDNDPSAHPLVVANVPGYTGVMDWTNETCDLSAYAGQTVYLSFRAVTDWVFQGNPGAPFPPGWWVKNIMLGSSLIADGTSLTGWQSPTEVNPIEVSGFTVYLIGYSSRGNVPVRIAQLTLDSNFDATLNTATLQSMLGRTVNVVAAVVFYDEPTELITQYAPYTLTVNGVTQPGG